MRPRRVADGATDRRLPRPAVRQARELVRLREVAQPREEVRSLDRDGSLDASRETACVVRSATSLTRSAQPTPVRRSASRRARSARRASTPRPPRRGLVLRTIRIADRLRHEIPLAAPERADGARGLAVQAEAGAPDSGRRGRSAYRSPGSSGLPDRGERRAGDLIVARQMCARASDSAVKARATVATAAMVRSCSRARRACSRFSRTSDSTENPTMVATAVHRKARRVADRVTRVRRGERHGSTRRIPTGDPDATSRRPRFSAIQTTGSSASGAYPEIEPLFDWRSSATTTKYASGSRTKTSSAAARDQREKNSCCGDRAASGRRRTPTSVQFEGRGGGSGRQECEEPDRRERRKAARELRLQRASVRAHCSRIGRSCSGEPALGSVTRESCVVLPASSQLR